MSIEKSRFIVNFHNFFILCVFWTSSPEGEQRNGEPSQLVVCVAKQYKRPFQKFSKNLKRNLRKPLDKLPYTIYNNRK